MSQILHLATRVVLLLLAALSFPQAQAQAATLSISEDVFVVGDVQNFEWDGHDEFSIVASFQIHQTPAFNHTLGSPTVASFSVRFQPSISGSGSFVANSPNGTDEVYVLSVQDQTAGVNIDNQGLADLSTFGGTGTITLGGSETVVYEPDNSGGITLGYVDGFPSGDPISISLFTIAEVRASCDANVCLQGSRGNVTSASTDSYFIISTTYDYDPFICGDSSIDGLEECDDGNGVSGDGCDSDCKAEVCGDGIVTPGIGEECDDGNVNSEDLCSSDCLDEFCGDGVRQIGLGEQCDDGGAVSGDGCSTTCIDEFCGDGFVQGGLGETCDDFNMLSGDGCSSTCVADAVECGDEVLDIDEECDDGNTESGDGCSASCTDEFGGSGGSWVCGNGVRNPGEQCDDGNMSDGDGCSAACSLEAAAVPALGLSAILLTLTAVVSVGSIAIVRERNSSRLCR